MNNDAYKTQHGGTHYVNMGMQPIYFAMVNGWDAGAFSILKYVSRHRTKNGLEDLKKARHFMDLRQAEIVHALWCARHIRMDEYIEANKVNGLDTFALFALDEWVKHGNDERRLDLIALIEVIMAEYTHAPLL
jgi:hypothetical protein